MSPPSEYVAILRCQTWNVWPEKTVIEHRSFTIDYGAPERLPARLAILSYLQRTSPERFLKEGTEIGPLLWSGDTEGFHCIMNTALIAPEDVMEILFKYRHAQRGEVDICINFQIEGELVLSLIEALRSTANSIMSLLNLQFKDYLVPTVPFQVRKVLPGGENQQDSTASILVRERQTLTKKALSSVFTSIAGVLLDSPYGERFRIALELYAAHFTEQQIRVRFLLLVIAIEALAESTEKHEVAIKLQNRWQMELEAEKAMYPCKSEQWLSLEALGRELHFRREDSIRTQVRKLFANIASQDATACEDLQRRALSVYDKRSVLVHKGHLPADELLELEGEARVLLETLLRAVMAENSLRQQGTSGV